MAEDKNNKTPKQKYWDAMDKFLNLRGELVFDAAGYKSTIITNDSIIDKCYHPLRECGFIPPSSTREECEDSNGVSYTQITTPLEHIDGHTEVKTDRMRRWTIYPDGYDKQIKDSFDYQCAITYMERQHLNSLLWIKNGFNPEAMEFKKDVKAGNIVLIDQEKIAHIRALLSGNASLASKVCKAYNVSSAEKIQLSDYDDVLQLINKNIESKKDANS